MIRTSMKLIGNRNNPKTLNGVMEWSNKMDLIALASENGEVTINRFKFDMPIKIPAPDEKLEVRSLAWRMDEKILGIAYDNGLVSLIDVESKDEIHSLNVNGDISSICWTQNMINIDEQEKELMKTFQTYLAPLPALNMLSGNKKTDYNAEKFYSEDALNFLLVTTTDAKIHIYIYGILHCGFIDIAKDLNIEQSNIKLLEVKLSRSLKELYVIYKINSEIKLVVYDNQTLIKYNLSLWKLSVKYGTILNILGYIEDTIQQITEAWEIVLLEMDKKLTKYAKKQLPGSVSADFLELLMFGYPSEALNTFLTQDLTERELKKLGSSIDLSYTTIQKLVVKPLHNAVVALFYHINEVYGMHQNVFYYKDLLGEATRDAMMNVGAFLIKCYELQQTIDRSIRDFKIFFRWLFIAIARILNETLSTDDAAAISQQEINYLAEFLNNFEQNRQESVDDAGEKEIKFNLERIGQYLADKNLVIPVKDDNGFWENILEDNECVRTHSLIFPHHKHLSLIQQKNLMKSSIEDVFGRLKNSIGRDFKMIGGIENRLNTQISSENNNLRTSHMFDEENDRLINYFSVLTSPETLQLIVCFENGPIKTFELKFISNDESIIPKIGKLSFTDAKFYNSKLISLLLKNQIDSKSQSCFMQLAVNRITDSFEDSSIVDLYKFIDETNFKSLEGFNGHSIAVSGSRNVSAILSTNFKIIRLYDMEVEDDDGDEEIEASFVE